MAIRNDDVSLALFRDKCREYNLKTTPQRTIIYKELYKSKDHPSTDAIFRKVRKVFPNISFDTVNRTVLTFAKIGLINVVEGYGEPRRFDSDTENHHHLRCIKCNRIIDFQNKYYDNIKIPDKIRDQFTVLRKRVCIEGICSKCQ